MRAFRKAHPTDNKNDVVSLTRTTRSAQYTIGEICFFMYLLISLTTASSNIHTSALLPVS